MKMMMMILRNFVNWTRVFFCLLFDDNRAAGGVDIDLILRPLECGPWQRAHRQIGQGPVGPGSRAVECAAHSLFIPRLWKIPHHKWLAQHNSL